ncbi:MAG: hypothetical protein IMF26_07900 [Candidatus Fermentithermobacillus carboniphilus]|uniref:RnfC Barrel sandwich hybrid domain-containing protein n=1 Tax=Candidatus Fermentithermobacillus carboniphilus TaxID=3085328 RepID=A0AAT9LAA5_9FIRM|nr:MAG: hypothetical protein IMF26_07900 [Candidatus Fermentithermobacillus carboniphilus]
MAVSLASSSKIESMITLIRKTRKLPLPGEVLVKAGDLVDPDTPVARIALRPGIPWVIPAARLLGIEPQNLSKCMLVKVGDKVKTKDVIARAEQGLYGRKELESPTDGVIEDVSDRSGRITIREEFGKEEPPITFDVAFEIKCKPEELPKHMLRHVGQEVKKGQMIAKKGEAQAFFTKTAVAPVSGIISDIDTKTGKVTISRPFKQVIVNAYIQGKVSSIIEKRGCVVETPGIKINGIFGLGRETHGVLKVLTKGPEEVLTPEMITEDCKDKIIVGGSFATNEALARALEVGVKGVITGTVNYFNLTQSLGVKLGVGITGQEDIDITVILMEGFGHLNMRKEVWETLKALEGRVASINGATQIRAGAIRPEIIVPFPDYTGPLAADAVVDSDLKVGMHVRVVNEPYFGAMGKIVEIVKEPQIIETEAKVPVVKVDLEDGRRVVVPRANVEVF